MKPLALVINQKEGEMKKMKRSALSCIVILSAIVCFSTSALAVEDGLGTNVVKNLRVQDDGTLIINTGGSIMLGDDAINEWNDLIMLPLFTDLNSITSKVTNLETSTNALNTATNALQIEVITLNTATNELNTATNSLQLQAKALQDATNTLNTATNALQVQAKALQDATNTLNTAKYDKIGGPISGNVNISGDVTMSNKVVYVPSVVEVVVAGTAIGSGQAVKTISSVGNFAMTANPPIAPGTAGQMITLIYTGAAGNSVTLTNNNDAVEVGLGLSGEVSFTMQASDVIQFIFDGTRWIEVQRADNRPPQL